MEALLIFPHQLFENHPGLNKNRPIFLIEDETFFSKLSFHKQKLIFHRASLKAFEAALKKRGYKTHYIEDNLDEKLKKINVLYTTTLNDHALEKRISSLCKKMKIKLEILPSPSFTITIETFKELFKGKKHFRLETLYIHQRKNLHLLLDKSGKPVGGKWSFDTENRSKAPKDLKVPAVLKFSKTASIKEAISYVEKKYPKNPGSCESFNYPTTHIQAKKALKDFLEKRLKFFGCYQDAIVQEETILFHSCLSPLLNVGLLNPNEVIEEAIEYAQKHKISLNNIEGFVRQVIGWREFVFGVYHMVGEKQRKENFFKHKRKLPKSFYDGTTGILPIDKSIHKLQKTAYLHHIERLMILGNFFLLCEIDPKEIYKWFMELFIDAYDWVMVPNVYGMSQYADGGMMTTKPYFSSSNYVLKMSDYPKGDWCEIWDALFWRFMIKHSKFFAKQPRLMMLCKTAQKKKKDLKLLRIANDFLAQLDKS